MLLVKHKCLCVHTTALNSKHVSNRNTYSCYGWGSKFEEGDTRCPAVPLMNSVKDVVRGQKLGALGLE